MSRERRYPCPTAPGSGRRLARQAVDGLPRADAELMLDTFFVLRKYEQRDHGEFRTKRLVLAAYDAITTAAQTGAHHTSPLDPAPGLGPRHLRQA